MQELSCTNCGSVDDYRISHTGEHKTAYCNGCGAYLKHIPQGTPVKLHFGKFKGRFVNSMTHRDELDYLKWLLSLDNLKENLKAAIDQQLSK